MPFLCLRFLSNDNSHIKVLPSTSSRRTPYHLHASCLSLSSSNTFTHAQNGSSIKIRRRQPPLKTNRGTRPSSRRSKAANSPSYHRRLPSSTATRRPPSCPRGRCTGCCTSCIPGPRSLRQHGQHRSVSLLPGPSERHSPSSLNGRVAAQPQTQWQRTQNNMQQWCRSRILHRPRHRRLLQRRFVYPSTGRAGAGCTDTGCARAELMGPKELRGRRQAVHQVS